MMSPVEVERSKLSTLELHAKQSYGSLKTVQKDTEKELLELQARKARYTLLGRVRELLPGERVAVCSNEPIPGEQVKVHYGPGAYVSGLQVCNNGNVCPVCASKKARVYRAEIEVGLDAAADLGYKVLMVTSTARHSRDMKAGWVLEKLKAAKANRFTGRYYKEFKERVGYVGAIGALETLWWYANGWHIHYHEIFILDKDISAAELEEIIYPYWENSLNKQGLDCIRGVGVKVTEGRENIAKYVTKWGLSNELVDSGKKDKGQGLSPFEMLAMFDDNPERYAWAGGLFREYAKAIKGTAAVRWSKGLKELLVVTEKVQKIKVDDTGQAEIIEVKLHTAAVEAALEIESEPVEGYVVLTTDQVRKIVYSGRRGVIGEMVNVATRGRDALLLWLQEVFDIVLEAEK